MNNNPFQGFMTCNTLNFKALWTKIFEGRAPKVSSIGRVPIIKAHLLLKGHEFNSLDTLGVRLHG